MTIVRIFLAGAILSTAVLELVGVQLGVPAELGATAAGGAVLAAVAKVMQFA